jgi:predicted ArsR family transcriptional regulator
VGLRCRPVQADQLPPTRRSILEALKRDGPAPIAELAARLQMSGEAVRQQLLQLQREGWIEAQRERGGAHRSGRPAARYKLTVAGDHLFPKSYDELAIAVVDTVAAQLGPEALARVLSALTETRAKQWEPRLTGKSLRERVEALKGVYEAEDPFMRVEEAPGGFQLVEQNCPFLNVALHRPGLCSVTVSLLSRLLGVQVVREERFQDGHGRCAFRVYPELPLREEERGFRPEPEPDSARFALHVIAPESIATAAERQP